MRFITKWLLLISVGLMTWENGNATIVAGGDVSGTWTKANSPYYVKDGSVAVRKGATLTIEPGVTVAFANGCQLAIDGGQLLAQGTENDSIVFTRQNDNWAGITIVNQGKSILEYASIQYVDGYGISIDGTATINNNTISNGLPDIRGGGGVFVIGGTVTLNNNVISSISDGGVIIYGGTVTLSNNLISKNSDVQYACGVDITGGTVTLTNNTISNNSAGQFGGGVVISGGIITIDNNTISDNSALQFGGGLYINGGTVKVSNNEISNNSAAFWGGGICINGTASVVLNDNKITNNAASGYLSQSAGLGGGISIYSETYIADPTIEMYNNFISGNTTSGSGAGVYIANRNVNVYNNIISNNKHDLTPFISETNANNGGGIMLSASNSRIINNTIVYNDAENGGGIYCGGSNPVIINNIIYGNTGSSESQIYIFDNNSVPNMLYNLNQSNSWELGGNANYDWQSYYDASNFDADPQFVDAAAQDYHLKSTSPCINAGITDTTGLNLPSVDLDGNIRIFGGRIDLGAYEYGAPTGIEPAVAGQKAAFVFPNPSSDGIFYIIANANKIEWTVYDLSGKQLLTDNQPLVDLSACGKGIYILKTGNRTAKLIRL